MKFKLRKLSLKHLRCGLTSTSTVWLVGYFYVRTNRPFGKFLLLVHRISWWQLGNVERSPSVGNLCRALEFSSPNRVSTCWPICTRQCHLSRCLRIRRMEPSHPIQRRSIPRLPSLVPCCVAINSKIPKWIKSKTLIPKVLILDLKANPSAPFHMNPTIVNQRLLNEIKNSNDWEILSVGARKSVFFNWHWTTWGYSQSQYMRSSVETIKSNLNSLPFFFDSSVKMMQTAEIALTAVLHWINSV